MIVRERGPSTTLRVLFANAAARSLWSIPATGGLLASVVRRPEVLEVAEKTLETGQGQSFSYESSASAGRFWRAACRPLPSDPSGRKLGLLT